MAEPEAPATAGSNHLGLRIGDKILSLQSQNLVLIVLIVGLAFLNWQRTKLLESHLDVMQQEQRELRNTLATGQLKIADALHTEETALRETVTTTHQQLSAILAAWREQATQTLQAHDAQQNAHIGGVSQRLERLEDLLRRQGPGP